MPRDGHNLATCGSHMVFRIDSQSEKRRGVSGPSTPGASRIYHTRKPHSKSRRGCLHCKAGRVKCDEVKPSCQRCQEKSISCDYISSTKPSAPNNQRAARQSQSNNNSLAEFQPVPPPLCPGEKRPLDLRLLYHFQTFTSHDLGSPPFDGGNEDITLSLALEHSHLMHAVFAVSATQLRRLEPHNHHIRSAEIQHWQCALFSFRTALTHPFTRDNCDAILLSSILLNLMSFSFIPSSDLSPSGSWVFSSSPQNLNWLYVQLGLRHLLERTKPFHVHSRLMPIFLASDDDQRTFSDERPGIQGLPGNFVEVCGLTQSSIPENNPYHLPLRLLTPLLALERCDENIFKFLHWFASVDDKFASLLQQKDQPALLLFSYWLAMLCELNQWWCYERARRECTAICMFLKHKGNKNIIQLLEYPAKACGYVLYNKLN